MIPINPSNNPHKIVFESNYLKDLKSLHANSDFQIQTAACILCPCLGPSASHLTDFYLTALGVKGKL